MADDLKRFAFRECPLHGRFDLLMVAGLDEVGHGGAMVCRRTA
jgi:hypothetical protein